VVSYEGGCTQSLVLCDNLHAAAAMQNALVECAADVTPKNGGVRGPHDLPCMVYHNH
jgi:hypothetical protein